MVADLYALKKYRFGIDAVAVDYDVTPGQDARLASVTVKFNVAPTTSENLTITLNYVEGGEFSTLLLSTDPSDGSVTDILYQPDAPLYIAKNDSINIAYTNTDLRFVAGQVVMEVEQ